MGSKSPSVPTAPTPPTQAQTAADYAAALPVYYQAALQYEPQIAQMEKNIQSQLYPTTTALQEDIANRAKAGMNAPIADWYKQNVAENLKSSLGRNLVYNPQAQEQYGLATQQAYKDWGDYYTNLGLTSTGRQALTQPSNMLGTYTPAAGMSFAQQGYGTGANIYGTQMQNYMQQSQNPWANVAGSIAGGIGSGIGMGMGYKWMGK